MENEKREATNLYDLTGQESGIVVYQGEAVIVCNWANVCPNGGLPAGGPINGMLICWPGEIKVLDSHSVDDIRDELPGTIELVEGEEKVVEAVGMDIVSDENGDICALWGYNLCDMSEIYRNDDGSIRPTPGRVYELENDVKIIVPEGWC